MELPARATSPTRKLCLHAFSASAALYQIGSFFDQAERPRRPNSLARSTDSIVETITVLFSFVTGNTPFLLQISIVKLNS